MPPTKAQQRALRDLWLRDNQGLTYLRFRRKAFHLTSCDCLMVGWCGMVIGIEKDGYTHS